MRILFALLIAAAANAAEGPVIYERDPQSLINRLYLAVATRTLAGTRFGVDNAEPYFDPVDDPAKAAAVLDEFLAASPRQIRLSVLQKALLQNDLWAAFDTEARNDSSTLTSRLARAIWKLRLSAAEIDALPDNYARAASTGMIPSAFSAEHPDVAYLPPDLLDPQGPWIQVGEEGLGPVAPFHVQMLSGRSAFQVFINCPGGRAATLAYLDKLNLYLTPWALEPAEISSYSSTNRPQRMLARRLDRETPQFPAGTMLALVRRMLVVDDELRPVSTRITQKVQLRLYRQVPPTPPSNRAEFAATQSLYEWVLRRADLLAAQPAGLVAIRAGEHEFQRTAGAQAEPSRDELAGPVVLSTCGRCHSGIGIFSVNSYTQFLSGGVRDAPQLAPAANTNYQISATIEWKKGQFDWGLLQGLLERADSRRH